MMRFAPLRLSLTSLALGLLLWGCGENTAKKNTSIPPYEVHMGELKEDNQTLTGTYRLGFTDPIASAPTTKREFFLQFELMGEGSTTTVSTFGTPKVVKGEKKLRGGLNLLFTRQGNTVRGQFVTCCGDKLADMPPLVDFDARKPISMFLVVDNEIPRVQIFKGTTGSGTPVLDTEDPHVALTGELYKGEGTYWGVSILHGTLYEARVGS